MITKCCNNLEDAAAAKVVQLLLPHCSFADNNYEVGGELLDTALYLGKLGVAKVLHAAGADVHRKTDVMHHAVAGGNLAVVKWLQSLEVDARAAHGALQLLPLHCACEVNHSHIAEYLLASPGTAGDVNARNYQGHTALHFASSNKADDTISLLLQHGADVDARDIEGGTPVMTAASPTAVRLLLPAGADATAVSDHGRTVPHHQAHHGACAGILCLLLQAGANPTAVDEAGSTPAQVAARSRHSTAEARLSRAAEDYRKKHLTANRPVGNSSSDSISTSSSGIGNDSSSSPASLHASRSDSVHGTNTGTVASTTATCASSATTADTILSMTSVPIAMIVEQQ
jgi:ankyrin repeat protein